MIRPEASLLYDEEGFWRQQVHNSHLRHKIGDYSVVQLILNGKIEELVKQLNHLKSSTVNQRKLDCSKKTEKFSWMIRMLSWV